MRKNNTQRTIKRGKILNNARKLFWEKGYRESSMRDLARVCSCEPGNIYRYFTNKETILYEVIRDDIESILVSIRHLGNDNDTSPVEQLRELIRKHLDCALGYRRADKLLFDTEMSPLSPAKRRAIKELRDEYERILQKVISRGVESKVFSAVDVKVVSYCIASMLIRARLWYSAPGRLSKNEIADIMFKLALFGLTSRP